jgi:hypothetical protein
LLAPKSHSVISKKIKILKIKKKINNKNSSFLKEKKEQEIKIL